MWVGILFWVFGLVALVVAGDTARRILDKETSPQPPQENTALILPCRGVDPEFPSFLEALAGQSLAKYQLVFVVADPDDAAVPLIQDFQAKHAGLAKLVAYPPPPGYTGKIANMLGGVESIAGEDYAYLIFLDSDTVPDPEFAAHLIAPLVRNEALLTTGARVLVPQEETLAQWVASLWLLSSLPGVARPQWGSAWGGAMAIRAGDAKRLDVAGIWKNAFSDDHTLSRAVREDGGRIAFASHCLVTIPIHYDWPDLLDFLVRQLVTIRVHDFRLWLLTWVMVYPLLLLLVGLGQMLGGQHLGAGLTFSALLPLVFAYYIINETIWKRLQLPAIHFRKRPILQQAGALAALILVHPVAMVRSALLRDFVWRGRRYVIQNGKISTYR
jgi:hypothetical protein